ncbi:hypothetical protein GKZ89_19765 [Bacillus mangrovi]|uniref:Uncharacterized protein n=1 Tax=Metabacillus mangrovi TaxID=1491830 RepID=A0A7X2V6N9_9BACI|nr:hypothetical protein [Metabacillus mangrovi]MTH55635.1 hypothetical protein [Metabacillus mangrovi]
MYRWSVLIGILFILVSAGCGGISEEEMVKQTEAKAAKAFEAKAKKPTDEIKSGSFFVPEGYKVSSKQPNNVILTKDDRKHLLFINRNEPEDSKASYEALHGEYRKWLVDRTFEHDGGFGYVLVFKLKDELYEVTAGNGGNKMTANAQKKDVPAAADEMIQVLKSIR